MMNLDSFKAYDIRGRIPDEINESLAYDVARAYAAFVRPKRVAVGYDIRLSSRQSRWRAWDGNHNGPGRVTHAALPGERAGSAFSHTAR